MKYQYDDSIIKILVGDKDNYITQITEYQDVKEKAEYKIAYQKHQQEIKEIEIDEMLNDIISKKPLRVLAKKYGKDFIKNHRAYREFASMVVFEETHNKVLADSIESCNHWLTFTGEQTDLSLKELEKIYDKR